MLQRLHGLAHVLLQVLGRQPDTSRRRRLLTSLRQLFVLGHTFYHRLQPITHSHHGPGSKAQLSRQGKAACTARRVAEASGEAGCWRARHTVSAAGHSSVLWLRRARSQPCWAAIVG